MAVEQRVLIKYMCFCDGGGGGGDDDDDDDNNIIIIIIIIIGKVNFHPRTGHEGSEGECRYSSTLSLTSALDVGGWSTPRPGRFTSGKDPVPNV
jgi:hypothetical protein